MALLPLHQAHDYRALVKRWQALARSLKTDFRVLAEVPGNKVHWFETGPRDGRAGPAVYLSSGVHGDEPAAAWGLLLWAEAHTTLLRKHPFLVFPCLNPAGLAGNTRTDHRGLDLNRRFHVEDDDICGPWRKVVLGREFSLGLCLHEDYDGQGCYVYELSHRREAFSHSLMKALKTLPHDPRRSIDGSRALDGVIRRKKAPLHLPGLPEAIVLHQLGCQMTLTFETPSEFSFDDRVCAQAEFVNAALSAWGITA